MTPPSSNPSRWRAWVAGILIFLLGFGLGGVCVFGVGAFLLRRAAQSPTAGFRLIDRATDRLANDVVRQLDLTPEQAAYIHTEFAQTAARIKTIRVQQTQETRREIRATIFRIAQSLPEEKRAEFRRIVRQHLQRGGVDAEGSAPPPPPKQP